MKEKRERLSDWMQWSDPIDVRRRSALAMRNVFEMADPRFNHVTYIGASLSENPPHFVHHRLGWTEALPYSVVGAVIGRKITQEVGDEKVVAGQRSLLLSHFTGMDGFVHSPASPWSAPYPMDIWEQARTLYALIYWFGETGEERLLDYAEAMVDGLFKLSVPRGSERVFPANSFARCSMGPYGVGAIIDPLLWYYQMSGNHKALMVGIGTAEFFMDPANGFFDEQWGAKGFFRSVVACLNGFSKAAAVTGDPRILSRAKCLHDAAVSRCTAYGSTPCGEPACSDFELNGSALSLVQAGYPEYWDQIDRFIRNQTARSQFIDPNEYDSEKASKKRVNLYNIYDGYPDDLQVLPFDDYRDVVNRSVGGAMWCSPSGHSFFPASLMICCTSHVLRSFEIAWDHSLYETNTGLVSDLQFSVDNALGTIVSHEPKEGRAVFTFAKDTESLRIRIPSFADVGKVALSKNGESVPTRIERGYLVADRLSKGCAYDFTFPLAERESVEWQQLFEFPDYDHPAATGEYRVQWRGNSCVLL
ncbi:MAG: hypothetical protein CVV48_07705 [Spirochaetae bacterium HGW-Spirochaetae-4]|nr:MAG: hypothetical protein CVV48_07705 [Spirochaetae bacterium HGW-Spirochaetae-4]